jgi:hypothetical protein
VGGGELGAIVEFPTRRVLSMPLSPIPGGQAVLDAKPWVGWSDWRRWS